jgi:hypothetical protein
VREKAGTCKMGLEATIPLRVAGKGFKKEKFERLT